MNLYLVARWGNPYDPEGPDGDDTNFLVKATSHLEAASIVDKLLARSESQFEDNLPVDDFCHDIRQVSTHVLGHDEPGIIHGPWLAPMLVQGLESGPTWQRTDRELWKSGDTPKS